MAALTTSPVAVAFRLDAGPGVGLGHLMRCAALSHELRRRAAHTTALVEGDEQTAAWARELRAFNGVQWLNSRLQECMSWSVWRNTYPQPPWRRAVVLDRPWQPGQTLLPASPYRVERWPDERVAIFVDAVVPVGSVDLVINPNVDWAAADWSRLAPGAEVLAGPRFACLWRPPSVRDPSRDGAPVRRLLVTMGGSDPHGVTARVLCQLPYALYGPWAVQGQRLGVDVVAGPGMAPERRDHLRGFIQRVREVGHDFVLHEHLHGLRPLIEAVDLVICAGGSTLYELACAGRPAVVLPQTPAEARHAAALERAGTCVVTDLAGVEATVASLCRDGPRRAVMSARGRLVVDGHGAERVAAALLAQAAAPQYHWHIGTVRPHPGPGQSRFGTEAVCPECGAVCVAGYDEAVDGSLRGDGTWQCGTCGYFYDEDEGAAQRLAQQQAW